MKTLHKGPFPLHITQNEDHFVIITSQGNHYAKTFDPSAARLIAAAPDLLSALDWALRQIEDDLDPDHQAAFDAAHSTLRKAKGE
jgi:ABC-type bacteriocin/lantibiotic exporter with double-glycine peptidase domain